MTDGIIWAGLDANGHVWRCAPAASGLKPSAARRPTTRSTCPSGDVFCMSGGSMLVKALPEAVRRRARGVEE